MKVGIPLALVALLLIFVFWTLGYLLGIYVLGAHAWIAFGGTADRLSAKLLVITVDAVTWSLATLFILNGIVSV